MQTFRIFWIILIVIAARLTAYQSKPDDGQVAWFILLAVSLVGFIIHAVDDAGGFK
jgi:hypothetical protein